MSPKEAGHDQETRRRAQCQCDIVILIPHPSFPWRELPARRSRGLQLGNNGD